MGDRPAAVDALPGSITPPATEAPTIPAPMPVMGEVSQFDELNVLNEQIDTLFTQKAEKGLAAAQRGDESQAQTAWGLLFYRQMNLSPEAAAQARNKAVLVLKTKQLQRIEPGSPLIDQAQKKLGGLPDTIIANFIDECLEKTGEQNKLTPAEKNLIESGTVNIEDVVAKPEEWLKKNLDEWLVMCFKKGGTEKEAMQSLIKKIGDESFLKFLNASLFGSTSPQEILQRTNSVFSEIARTQAPDKLITFLKNLTSLPQKGWDSKWSVLMMLAMLGPGLLASLLPEEALRAGR